MYKENRDDWRHAEIVVSTVQSLLFNNKFTRLFSPVDFDLVISDEAHRSILRYIMIPGSMSAGCYWIHTVLSDAKAEPPHTGTPL
ncbi:MAG: hypothetical protein NTY95_00295 [Bacteroidia bacterium]|nr:hypothetical protein [Bacteroidia bacterium]